MVQCTLFFPPTCDLQIGGRVFHFRDRIREAREQSVPNPFYTVNPTLCKKTACSFEMTQQHMDPWGFEGQEKSCLMTECSLGRGNKRALPFLLMYAHADSFQHMLRLCENFQSERKTICLVERSCCRVCSVWLVGQSNQLTATPVAVQTRLNWAVTDTSSITHMWS
ncbi:hypothetical protein LY78DRAFT_428954 [Colletotrichum sublineola]|nr:hypothetical protein LY78DRAFT_428954 [Colletotrichum sublineola]